MIASTEGIDWVAPSSMEEALNILAEVGPETCILAGGTDLMVQWRSGIMDVPARVVSILGIPKLQSITEVDQEIYIGACVTHAELKRSTLVQKFATSTRMAAGLVGGMQIQTRGTIGGNIVNASPAGDLVPALLVADAEVVVIGLEGERRMPLVDFFKGYRQVDLRPGELLSSIVLEKKKHEDYESFIKLGPRAAQAISKIMAAIRLRLNDGQVESVAVALGSVAPTAIRLAGFEEWLAGKTMESLNIDEVEHRVSDAISPIDDIRSTARYRKWVSGRIVRKMLEDAK